MGEIKFKDHLRKVECLFTDGNKIKGVLFLDDRFKKNNVVFFIHNNRSKIGGQSSLSFWENYGKYSWGIRLNDLKNHSIKSIKFINNNYELWEK